VCAEQSLRSEKDRRWSSARFLDLDLEETSPSAASIKPPESAQDISDSPATAVPETHESLEIPKPSHQRHRHLRVCLKDPDEESLYVEDLLQACSFPSEIPSSNYVIDPTIFDQLESKRVNSSEQDVLDRRILFDCVNEVLERLLEAQLRWSRLQKRPVGVKEVLTELEDVPCVASEDVCDTVYVILQKDLLKGRGQQWSDYNKELEEVGVAVERMIVKDLIDETVRELNAWQSHLPVASESSRRQLFA